MKRYNEDICSGFLAKDHSSLFVFKYQGQHTSSLGVAPLQYSMCPAFWVTACPGRYDTAQPFWQLRHDKQPFDELLLVADAQ